jgi:hypothetical protein
VVALLGDSQLDVGSIRRSDIRFSHEECTSNLSIQQWLQPFVLLSLCAVLGQNLHVSSIWGSAVRRLGCQSTACQYLGHQSVLQVAESSSFLEVVLGQEHVPETKLLCCDLKIVHDGWVSVEALLGTGAKLGLPDSFGGNALIFDKLLELFGWCLVSDLELGSDGSDKRETYNINCLDSSVADKMSNQRRDLLRGSLISLVAGHCEYRCSMD